MTSQSLLQGEIPDSQNEINVAIALTKLGFEYDYQRWTGIPGVAGSQQVDFLVFIPPQPVPLFVHGRYWHTGKKASEDALKMAELTATTKGRWADPVIIWDDECETVDDAFINLKRLLIA